MQTAGGLRDESRFSIAPQPDSSSLTGLRSRWRSGLTSLACRGTQSKTASIMGGMPGGPSLPQSTRQWAIQLAGTPTTPSASAGGPCCAGAVAGMQQQPLLATLEFRLTTGGWCTRILPPTWGQSQRRATLSTASTTPRVTAQAIVAGRRQQSRVEIAGPLGRIPPRRSNLVAC